MAGPPPPLSDNKIEDEFLRRFMDGKPHPTPLAQVAKWRELASRTSYTFVALERALKEASDAATFSALLAEKVAAVTKAEIAAFEAKFESVYDNDESNDGALFLAPGRLLGVVVGNEVREGGKRVRDILTPARTRSSLSSPLARGCSARPRTSSTKETRAP